ncbi:N-acetylmuramoyl-L-alanine amidase [Streptomyces carminius]|uniref:N-acetylmuramoyl-L-alanine amidase n=1 Tax=Streptomyces carminius TaxID=2665496 RepID=A0A2M8LP80_9ACTN|nr:N-acetylmuramoyl-L-alanine amidase [Streptomyces carminius]PJE93720.1 N-acetylmuramoyl-L-alanine amidase [Streptomyces carminius]
MRSRRIWGTGAAVAAGVAGVLVAQGVIGSPVGGAGDDGKSGGTGKPVRSGIHSAALKVAGDGRSAESGRRDVKPFSMLGVTWTDPGARVEGTVEARTRAAGTGKWSGWLVLDGDSGQGESGAGRGGTEPAWVGPSDGVEVRVRSGGKSTAGLPEGLRLDMVDPGGVTVTDLEPAAFTEDEPTGPATGEPTGTEPTGPAEPAEPSPGEASPQEPEPDATDGAPATDTPPASEAPTSAPPATSAPPTATGEPSTTASPSPSVSVPPAPPSTAPRPPVTARAGWGADESISPEEPGYLPDGKVKAVTVHHTAESNSYTCDQAPAVVRGIYAYHVRTLGWKDIGYNFLVDKCGKIYEGRKGGVDRPVMGAHAYGFNSETTGISVLGTYTGTSASTAALTSVARIAAWKLGQYGVAPSATVTLTAGDSGRNYAGRTWAKGARLSFPAVHGHRDGYNTQCPGDRLYGQLSTIRAYAAGPPTGLALTSVTGAGKAGTAYYTRAAVTVGWKASTPATLLTRYELLVDGKVVATAANTAASAKATLPAGTHKVAVRAVHVSGRSATSAAATVVAETTAPIFTTKPNLVLRTGTVNTAAVPLTLRWKASDNAALKEVKLTKPVARTYGPTTTSASHTARSGTATAWSLTVRDQAGNAATASVTGTPVILQESSAKKSGTWSTRSSSSYLGGKSYSSSARNASLTWTFTGRSAAWTVSRASSSGQVHVYVDGVKAATVDLKSSTTKYRQAIWTKSWTSSGKHTVKIVVVGTKGRPTITTDGLVYLK